MNQQTLLKSVDYSVPSYPAGESRMGRQNSHPFGMYSPMVQVNIDFEKRNLFMEGASQLITSSGRYRETIKTKAEKKKVIVKAVIYPGAGIELSERPKNDFVFSLEGTIDDGKSIHSCSGLLVVNGVAKKNEAGFQEWQLAVYLYDDDNNARKIELTLTMYSISENADLN